MKNESSLSGIFKTEWWRLVMKRFLTLMSVALPSVFQPPNAQWYEC